LCTYKMCARACTRVYTKLSILAGEYFFPWLLCAHYRCRLSIFSQRCTFSSSPSERERERERESLFEDRIYYGLVFAANLPISHRILRHLVCNAPAKPNCATLVTRKALHVPSNCICPWAACQRLWEIESDPEFSASSKYNTVSASPESLKLSGKP